MLPNCSSFSIHCSASCEGFNDVAAVLIHLMMSINAWKYMLMYWLSSSAPFLPWSLLSRSLSAVKPLTSTKPIAASKFGRRADPL